MPPAKMGKWRQVSHGRWVRACPQPDKPLTPVPEACPKANHDLLVFRGSTKPPPSQRRVPIADRPSWSSNLAFALALLGTLVGFGIFVLAAAFKGKVALFRAGVVAALSTRGGFVMVGFRLKAAATGAKYWMGVWELWGLN